MSTGKAQANFVINIIWHILAAGERVVVISPGLNKSVTLGHQWSYQEFENWFIKILGGKGTSI